MDIDLIFKIAGIGILISILNTVLHQAGKQSRPRCYPGRVVIVFDGRQLNNSSPCERYFASIEVSFDGTTAHCQDRNRG